MVLEAAEDATHWIRGTVLLDGDFFFEMKNPGLPGSPGGIPRKITVQKKS
jgi:hypothetical protein